MRIPAHCDLSEAKTSVPLIPSGVFSLIHMLGYRNHATKTLFCHIKHYFVLSLKTLLLFSKIMVPFGKDLEKIFLTADRWPAGRFEFRDA